MSPLYFSDCAVIFLTQCAPKFQRLDEEYDCYDVGKLRGTLIRHAVRERGFSPFDIGHFGCFRFGLLEQYICVLDRASGLSEAFYDI